MKVCEVCGNEIFTKDGDNSCLKCDNKPKKKKARRNPNDEIMKSLGLTKVKGAMGGVYWE